MYSTVKSGRKYGTDFQVYITKDGTIISPWHDISYKNKTDYIITVVNEIPRFENAKFEMHKNEKYNPIVQDTKNNKPRFVSNIFPYKGYIWNYGAIPQTWESPDIIDKYTNAKGDNDPIDVIEIGEIRRGIGEVYQAKVLGALAMLDGGECDWKILVIGVDAPSATLIDNITDVERYMPGLMDSTVDWFRNYKAPDQKTVDFALNAKFQERDFAMEVIEEAHTQWKTLFDSYRGDVSLINTSLKYTESYDASPSFPEIQSAKSLDFPQNLGGFFYVLNKK